MNSWIGAALIGVGVAFDVMGCIGLVRLPDVYTRMQAATKCVALGTLLIIAGAVVTVGTPSALAKGALCLGFLLLTSPTGSPTVYIYRSRAMGYCSSLTESAEGITNGP